MQEYMSLEGDVFVIHYPVLRAGGAGDDPLPPIEIASAVPQSGTSNLRFLVYVPYAFIPSGR